MKWVLPVFALLASVVPATGQTTRPTLWIIGDSTVRNGTSGQQGWGDPIKAMFDPAKVKVENRAIGGRSSRTFRTEGRWEKVLKEASPGDFVMMQFGHNDPAPLAGDNRERGTIRGEDDETREVTLTLGERKGQAETVHTYGWYMRQYIKEAKEKGLTPIVCSYIPRCPRPDEKNPDAKVEAPGEELNSYALWARNAAAAEGAGFIDLYTLVRLRYVGLTPAEVRQKYFTEADYTHTSPEGAKWNAECVVEGIRQLKDQRLAGLLAAEK
jgi:lysophospholipase L1-like esterase